MSEINIKELRLALGWSQERLARECAFSWATISNWERGICKPSELALARLEPLIERVAQNRKHRDEIAKIVRANIECENKTLVDPMGKTIVSVTGESDDPFFNAKKRQR